MRAGFAWAVMPAIPLAPTFRDQPHPNGLAHFMDLTFFADPETMGLIRQLYWLCAPLYVAGIALPVTLGWIFFVHAGVASLCNSQGAIGHMTQAGSLVLLAQWLASLWRLGVSRGGLKEALLGSRAAMKLAMDWSRQGLAAAYVVSALAKLHHSKGLWIWKTPLLELQVRKTNDMQYYNELSLPPKIMGWLADPLFDHPWLARIVLGAALPLELFAFLLCFNRRMAALFGVALWVFHSTVSELMRLGFALNKQMLVIFCINLPFWIYWFAAGRKSRTLTAADAAPAHRP